MNTIKHLRAPVTATPEPYTPDGRSAWTLEQVEYLEQHWGHKTARQIASELGERFTKSAVIGKANRIGLEMRRRN